MFPDLHSNLQLIREGRLTAQQALKDSLSIAGSATCRDAFLSIDANDSARAVETLEPTVERLSGAGPLGGLAFSVKDLFDVCGQVTRAGSRVLDRGPVAVDCTAVTRLRGAGGTMIGRTHMVEFAFSGVGTNPHFPTPAAWDARFDRPAGTPGEPRVPGGSSSGGAVSVATGAACIALGSDTGGSIRIPAALNGIVGFKSTACRVPTQGAFPLSTTLDTVCAMTRSVRDAVLAHEILAARRVVRSPAPLQSYRLAVARTTMLDDLDPVVALAFERTVRQLRDAGARIEEIALDEIRDLGAIQSTGGFTAAEAYATHREMLETRVADYDPRVSARILRGAGMKAHEYIELTRERKRWIEAVERTLCGYDAVLSPTVPILAPTLASVAPADGADAAQDERRDQAFFRANALLLRNTSVVNMLDGCAISIPCHVEDELPIGLMMWHGALRDDAILNLGLLAERTLQIQ